MPVDLGVFELFLFDRFFLLRFLLFLELHPFCALLGAAEDVEAVRGVGFELRDSCFLGLGAGGAGGEEEGGVLVYEALEELVETVLRAEEVELIVPRFSLHEGRHEGPAVLGHEQSCNSHNVEILGTDIRHPRGEVKVWRWGRPFGFLWFRRWNCFTCSPC